jgi:hypothetical protein
MSTQSARKASGGCQKNLLAPVRLSNLAKHQAQTNPIATVKKNGGK